MFTVPTAYAVDRRISLLPDDAATDAYSISAVSTVCNDDAPPVSPPLSPTTVATAATGVDSADNVFLATGTDFIVDCGCNGVVSPTPTTTTSPAATTPPVERGLDFTPSPVDSASTSSSPGAVDSPGAVGDPDTCAAASVTVISSEFPLLEGCLIEADIFEGGEVEYVGGEAGLIYAGSAESDTDVSVCDRARFSMCDCCWYVTAFEVGNRPHLVLGEYRQMEVTSRNITTDVGRTNHMTTVFMLSLLSFFSCGSTSFAVIGRATKSNETVQLEPSIAMKLCRLCFAASLVFLIFQLPSDNARADPAVQIVHCHLLRWSH